MFKYRLAINFKIHVGVKTVKNMKFLAAEPVEREIFRTIYPRINLITDSNNFSMGLFV